jgi:hypothetical protein
VIIVGGAVGFTVQVDFSGTPFGGAAPTWTDITAWVLTSSQTPGGSPISIPWGRQDRMGDVTPSSVSVALQNVDGRFTPGNVASPYYPWVRHSARLRVFATVAGTTQFLFDGYVNDWVVTPSNGSYWVTSVDASDILNRFGSSTALRSFLAEEMLVDSPAFLYALQEDEGSTSFGDLTGQQPPATIGNSKHGAGVVNAGQDAGEGFFAGDVVEIMNVGSSAVTPIPETPWSWIQIPAVLLPTAQLSFETWIEMPAGLPSGGADTCLFSMYTNPRLGGALGSNILMNAGPSGDFNLVVEDSHGVAAGPILLAGGPYFDGNIHQFAFTVAADLKTVVFYLDGQAVATDFAPATLGPLLLGGPFVLGGPFQNTSASFRPFTGGWAYTALYAGTLSPTRILNHYAAGVSAFNGERTDSHVSRILSYRPNLGQSLDVGVGVVGSADIAGQTMQQALLDTSAAEGGVLYADGQGRIVMRSRSNQFNPAPVLTLDASLGQVDIPTTFRDDIQYVANDITVSRPNGADQRFVNQASIDQDGDATQSLSANVQTDAQALDLAAWNVAVGTQGQTSSPTLTVNLLTASNSGLILSVLQLRPLDVVQVVNLPAQSPATSMLLMVQGGTLTIAADELTAELYATPVPPSVVTSDGLVNGVGVAADTADSLTYAAAY